MNNTYLYIVSVLLLTYIIINHINFKKGLKKFGILPNHNHRVIEKFSDDSDKTTNENLNKVYDQLKKLKEERINLKDKTNIVSNDKDSKSDYINKLDEQLNNEQNYKLNYIGSNEETNTLNKIEQIKDQINYLNRKKIFEDNYMGNTSYNSVKSLQNGLDLSVQRIPKSNKYQINLNNGCLSIDSVGNYFTSICDKDIENQHFNLTKIKNDKMYQSQLYPNIPFDMNINPNGNLNYPFTLIKSTKNNNCVQNNHNNISIVPCKSKKSQRWSTSDKKIKCSEY